MENSAFGFFLLALPDVTRWRWTIEHIRVYSSTQDHVFLDLNRVLCVRYTAGAAA